jgi:hypothetical protein
MNIESLLEDLEAHFEAQTKNLNRKPVSQITNVVRTLSFTGEVNELTAPLIGRDFVAGFLDGGSNWLLIRHQFLQSIEEFHRPENRHPNRSNTNKTFQEVVQDFSFPAEISWRQLNSEPHQTRKGLALACRDGFLDIYLATKVCIPLLSVGQIQLKVVENYLALDPISD